jgi:microcystin-dependent protein
VTYSALFTAIGVTYGAGDGSSTFNLPDCRGRVTAGKDNMGGSSANRLTGIAGSVNGDVLGGAGGEERHTLSEAEMPSHDHDATVGFWPVLNAMGTYSVGSGGTFGLGSTSVVGGAGGNLPHNNVQPVIVFNKIIKA